MNVTTEMEPEAESCAAGTDLAPLLHMLAGQDDIVGIEPVAEANFGAEVGLEPKVTQAPKTCGQVPGYVRCF